MRFDDANKVVLPEVRWAEDAIELISYSFLETEQLFIL